jgi:hypothetical protein
LRFVHVREDETIAVDPVGVLGVESHELVEQDVGRRGHAHRGARVAGVGLEGGIDLDACLSQQLEEVEGKASATSSRRLFDKDAAAGNGGQWRAMAGQLWEHGGVGQGNAPQGFGWC